MKRRLACALVLVSCRPELGARDSLVDGLRVLAVRADPPEASEGATTHFDVLAATAGGAIVPIVANWDLCATPKLLTENGATSAGCLTSGVRPVASGAPMVDVAIPEDACALFGPDVTSADLRPRDPDVTGGYYQPMRVTVFAGAAHETAFGFARVACKLANAPADVTTDYARRYVANANPELDRLSASVAGSTVALDALPRGATITLRANWTASSAEPYVVFDLASRAVVERREWLRVSWFATAGIFASDRTGRDEAEPETFTDNRWTAPNEATTTHAFVVLRDARGGTAYASYDLVTR